MKVLLLTPYWLQTKGGITTATYYLSNELKKNGHSVSVITSDTGSGVITVPKNRLAMIWKIIEALRCSNPDVIHVHAHGSLLLPAVFYKRLFNRKVKLIFTFHTQPSTISYLDGKPVKERGTLKLFLLNYLLQYCDFTTYVSKSLKESLQKTGVKIVNPVVIPNGVKIKEVNSEDIRYFKQKYNLLNNYPVLCMVASFAWDWKVKGIMILIDAFKKILISQPKARLIIVGNGQYRKAVEIYAEEKNLKQEVIFTGSMNNPFIALFVCDIYCHISLNEALGIAPLESMIVGKPIVASNDGGLPEIITNGINGILVDSNPDSVAKAILTLLRDSNLMQSLSKNAIITTISKFSWERIALEYQKLYEKV